MTRNQEKYLASVVNVVVVQEKKKKCGGGGGGITIINNNRNVELVKDGYELIDVNIVPPQVNRVAPHKKSPKRFLLYYLHL